MLGWLLRKLNKGKDTDTDTVRGAVPASEAPTSDLIEYSFIPVPVYNSHVLTDIKDLDKISNDLANFFYNSESEGHKEMELYKLLPPPTTLNSTNN